MAISMKKYVDIKSAINTTRTATEKELIARIFTASSNVNPNAVIECENLADVGTIFGTSSEEYKIAEKYFGFINKYARSPKKISFYRDWRNGVNSYIVSSDDTTLATLQAISSGSIKVTIGSISKTISSINLSSATSFSDVASALQTAIRGADSDASFTSATVTADTNGRFTITSGTKAKASIVIEEANDSTLAEALNLVDVEGVEGRATGTIVDVFENSVQISNNFATFYFIEGAFPQDTITLTNYINNKYPVEFMFIVSTKIEWLGDVTEPTDATGVTWELVDDNEGKYNFVLPMAITATTDYNKENGTVNYMYTQYSEMGVVVDDDDTANSLDRIRVNYYGQTQKSGQKLAFYQNGVMQGDYQDQNIYVNEIWLKDALTTKYINYMLSVSNWYANKAGQAIGQGLAMDVIERAKLNGTITTEKEISEEDKVYIYNITADENAWRQIYQEGYYLTTYIDKKTINNQTTYTFNYVLLYSKGDSIKKVEGLNILI